jgi:urease accessory protein
MARALERVLAEIMPGALAGAHPITLAEVFSAAAVAFAVPEEAACAGYAFAWCESHVSAVAKLLPLGPVAAQRLVHALLAVVPAAITRSATIEDQDVGAAAPGLAVASARHETQYSRLFRS